MLIIKLKVPQICFTYSSSFPDFFWHTSADQFVYNVIFIKPEQNLQHTCLGQITEYRQSLVQ